ncbi:hypothetical protein TSO5_19555 [Azospirillum sp. TSO5]|nr:hypothetical protein TSO5_19555 [Azospirillum sp. TSO5]
MGCAVVAFDSERLSAPAQAAESSSQDAGAPILVVSGSTAGGQERSYSREEFEAMGLATLTTRTPWNQDPVEFSGVKLSTFLRQIGASGRTLRVTALNDYVTTIPIEDVKYDPILATRRDGKPMSIRDKGPIFIIYPFDDDKSLNSELFFSRCAWQVKSIQVE